jgi:protein O-GlcNAc transferase
MNRLIPLILLTLTLAPAVFAAANDRQETVAALEQNVKTNPNNSDLWVHLGLAYRDVNDTQKAESAFQKALSLNPRNTNALFMLGLLYEKKNQNQDALRTWQQLISVETDPARKQVAERHIHQLSQ